MYQWVEEVKEVKDGDTKRKEYSYKTEWCEQDIDSKAFKGLGAGTGV